MSVKFKVLILFIFNWQCLWTSVEAGCCNDNYWCDGDPRLADKKGEIPQALLSKTGGLHWKVTDKD